MATMSWWPASGVGAHASASGLATMPAVVRSVSDQQALGLALVENIQRRDLGALDEAAALHRLADEFDLTHQQIAELVGRSRAAVSNLLRLLSLPGILRQWLDEGRLEMGHARALLGLREAADQVAAAREVLERELSVAATERLVRRWKQPGQTRSAKVPRPRRRPRCRAPGNPSCRTAWARR